MRCLGSVDCSAGTVHTLSCPRDGLEAVLQDCLFTTDANSVFVAGDALQCLLDLRNIANLAVHRKNDKVAIAVPSCLRGFIIDFVFDDQVLAQLVQMAFQFRQSGAQQILEIVSRLQLFTALVGPHAWISLE